jgi:hypothetical protein
MFHHHFKQGTVGVIHFGRENLVTGPFVQLRILKEFEGKMTKGMAIFPPANAGMCKSSEYSS